LPQSFINLKPVPCLLAKKIDWHIIENEFVLLYENIGRPSIPIRTIVGLLFLKENFNLTDETVVVTAKKTKYFLPTSILEVKKVLPIYSEFPAFRHPVFQ
jgi:IS5 family transposase